LLLTLEIDSFLVPWKADLSAQPRLASAQTFLRLQQRAPKKSDHPAPAGPDCGMGHDAGGPARRLPANREAGARERHANGLEQTALVAGYGITRHVGEHAGDHAGYCAGYCTAEGEGKVFEPDGDFLAGTHKVEGLARRIAAASRGYSPGRRRGFFYFAEDRHVFLPSASAIAGRPCRLA